ncbi:MAG: transglycosylase domain-containing protein [Eubacteriales bacterium]
MSGDQKGTGIGSVFHDLGQKITGLFRFKNKEADASSREGNRPVFPPAGSYSDEKRRIDKDQTVIFSETEIKKNHNKQNFADTMYVPGLEGGGFASKKIGGSLFVPRTKKPNFVLGVILTSFKLTLAAIFVLVAVGAGIVLGLANAYLETTPELDVGKIQDQAQSSYIYDQDGTQLATYTGSENRDWITLDQIPLDLQHAVVAKEDIRFYSHNGVDVKRLAGALVSNITSSDVSGGSTITQQVIKNSILTNERSYKRKLQEAYLAMELEKKYTKDQILEAYLNTIPLGGTIYGVKTAAKEYFGKDLSQLTLKQEVCLAAIIESPHLYDPHRATYVTGDVGALQNKMNQVTERMYSAGFITKQQYNDTMVPKSVWSSPNYLQQWKSTMGVVETSASNALYPYPHFIEYVIYNVETMFLRKENLTDTKANRATIDSQIRQNGYKITCTIDQDVQNIVQTTVSQWNNYPSFK